MTHLLMKRRDLTINQVSRQASYSNIYSAISTMIVCLKHLANERLYCYFIVI